MMMSCQNIHVVVVNRQAGVRALFVLFCLTMIDCKIVKLYDGSKSELANLDDTPLMR